MSYPQYIFLYNIFILLCDSKVRYCSMLAQERKFIYARSEDLAGRDSCPGPCSYYGLAAAEVGRWHQKSLDKTFQEVRTVDGVQPWQAKRFAHTVRDRPQIFSWVYLPDGKAFPQCSYCTSQRGSFFNTIFECLCIEDDLLIFSSKIGAENILSSERFSVLIGLLNWCFRVEATGKQSHYTSCFVSGPVIGSSSLS